MFDRFTERARKVIILAKEEAKRFNHDYIGTEHILLGLIKEGESVAAAVLQNLGLSLDTIRLEIEKLVQFGPSTVVSGDIPFTPKAKKVIELALDEARRLGHNYIGTEHLLLGLIKEGEGVASHVLMNIGLDLNKVRAEVIKLLGSATPGSDSAAMSGGAQASGMGSGGSKSKTKTPALDAFGRDLSQLAREGKLDPVVGRNDEIERVIQILARRTKNNPVLLGEAGVGKTAIVEGLAQRIIAGDIPEILLDKRMIVLDLALMVAGTKYRGQFEERIKAVMDEIKRADNVIIFIDELHTLVGAGGAEGAIDASNILKPSLSRGEIQCIGATTLDEYRKYIEKDAALARRFQTVMVDPPSVDDTVQILKGLRDKYEAHHRVKITDEALSEAAKLSDRYITGRFLPDKAIDIIDEAASRARLSVTTLPKDLKKMETEIESLRREKEASIKGQDFEKAAKLRDEERKAKEELQKMKKNWKESKSEVEIQVTAEDIAFVVSKWTGVPLARLEEKETARLLKMEEEIHQGVIGQDEAITAIANAVRRSRSGLRNPRRPIGTFIFLGPTGVGKTLLARALAEFMFGDRDAVITVDCSEYSEKFNVSRLVGAPPGYVGYEEGGQLTEKVRRRPYSVVLLDEIEKAHPDMFNILLQLMEEGRLTDSLGRKVDFRNTIVIMTSNVGADLVRKQGDLGFGVRTDDMNYDSLKTKLLDETKKVFRPEFLNRVDDIIVFHPLSRQDLEQIIHIELGEVKDRLKEKAMELLLSDEVLKFLIDQGYDPVFGARPLKRTIQRYVENVLAEEILSGKFQEGDKIQAEIRGDRVVFEKAT
ncbi:MAG: Negative regulator of genetic competence ClpC/MecB [Candidatus Omnitrophica bacterium ADurb.Bin292]|jgi:ATP-dependent Clp protease ATP-binding subunit ClpC|nr:MAG: Negative regulator of genetic competence ClpC/MecB [Candidatus Omnitrophica bacterium ADurb.Bin292]HOG23356.1 ATP-dependent Clp protease ATP-binding subunit [Candidatus Omnitrophota bacterium]HPW76446.1 ATP-dependent Clp protease ATP-binding subunit [Candidatus Omnitrophota bacterium]HQB11525.1 ATP-dependent Clp protease ATP-binding subunit [Candidatus Omnitrophota bacterium]